MKRIQIAWRCSAVLILAGCGAEAAGLWGDLFVTPAITEACTGMMTESEMLTAVTMAQLDQINGYTKSEALQAAAEGCTTDAATGVVTYEQCMTCKTAIVDQVFVE